jgi:hypothetical protein
VEVVIGGSGIFLVCACTLRLTLRFLCLTRDWFGTPSLFLTSRKTPFSLLSAEEKNKVSHRGKAVRQWADWLAANPNELWETQSGRPAIGH